MSFNKRDFTYLKAGDKIYLQLGSLSREYLTEKTVDKVYEKTKKIKLVGSDTKFSSDGWEIHSGYRFSQLVHIDEKSKDQFQRQILLGKLEKVKFEDYNTEDLKTIIGVIKVCLSRQEKKEAG